MSANRKIQQTTLDYNQCIMANVNNSKKSAFYPDAVQCYCNSVNSPVTLAYCINR